MGRKGKAYTREFKEDAVRLVTEKGVSVSQVALDLGIHENTIYKWIRQYKADPEGAFPGKGRLKPQEEELRRLQRLAPPRDGARDGALLRESGARRPSDPGVAERGLHISE